MIKNNDHNTLKQLLISRINQTDDESLLQQCIDLLAANHAEDAKAEADHEEEGDEIIDTVTIASQIHGQHSDKQQLAQAMMKKEAPLLSPEEEEMVSSIPLRRSWRRLLWLLPAILLVVAGIWGFGQLKNCTGKDKQNGLTTTAEKYKTFTVKGVSFNMVYVDGGKFMMGAGENEREEADSDEFPAHQVTLSDYMIGETEVTEGLWKAVMGDPPLPHDGDDHPVKKVSWEDCQNFIKLLNEMTGESFSLPTEAQWEYAAIGGNRSHDFLYSGSDDLDQVGWYSANAWDKGKGDPDFGSHPVGSKAPNELGLYDMSGNVWEWVQDSFSRYSEEAQTDPKNDSDDMHSFRVNRGGSWDYIATSSRSSNRRIRTPDFRNFNLGLRLALPASAYQK